jgi:hypothetical protein
VELPNHATTMPAQTRGLGLRFGLAHVAAASFALLVLLIVRLAVATPRRDPAACRICDKPLSGEEDRVCDGCWRNSQY